MKLKIDYVADLGSGWCALNLHSLREAIDQLPEIDVELDICPFEQYPDLPPEGVDIREHFAQTCGADVALATQTRAAMREWARELDFDFRPNLRTRAYNTFDGLRLLRWARAQPGAQVQQDLALALFDLTFNRGGNVSEPAQLLQCVEMLGLDVTWAGQVLRTDAFADEVHHLEAEFHEQGIDVVPALYANGNLISQGSQTPPAYMTLLRVAAGLA